MRAFAMLLAVWLGACVSASGAPDAPAPFTRSEPAAATAQDFPVAIDLPAGPYRLDPRHASVGFRIRHQGLAWVTARFNAKQALLTLDPADPSRSRLEASVEAESVDTGVLTRDGERAFDRQIAAALGAARTPRMTFVSTAIARTGEHTARVTGELTMNGQTRPAVLDVTFRGAAVDPLRGGATVLGFSAYGEIERSQWGVTAWRAFTGDTVQIVIEAELVRE